MIETNNPYIAVASAKPAPIIKAVVILPLASGCLAIPSTAFPVAFPIPIAAPIPTNTDIAAANALTEISYY